MARPKKPWKADPKNVHHRDATHGWAAPSHIRDDCDNGLFRAFECVSCDHTVIRPSHCGRLSCTTCTAPFSLNDGRGKSTMRGIAHLRRYEKLLKRFDTHGLRHKNPSKRPTICYSVFTTPEQARPYLADPKIWSRVRSELVKSLRGLVDVNGSKGFLRGYEVTHPTGDTLQERWDYWVQHGPIRSIRVDLVNPETMKVDDDCGPGWYREDNSQMFEFGFEWRQSRDQDPVLDAPVSLAELEYYLENKLQRYGTWDGAGKTRDHLVRISATRFGPNGRPFEYKHNKGKHEMYMAWRDSSCEHKPAPLHAPHINLLWMMPPGRRAQLPLGDLQRIWREALRLPKDAPVVVHHQFVTGHGFKDPNTGKRIPQRAKVCHWLRYISRPFPGWAWWTPRTQGYGAWDPVEDDDEMAPSCHCCGDPMVFVDLLRGATLAAWIYAGCPLVWHRGERSPPDPLARPPD